MTSDVPNDEHSDRCVTPAVGDEIPMILTPAQEEGD